MSYKIKVAAVSTLTQGLCSLKISIRQIPEIDNVWMTKHSTQFHQILLLKNVTIDTFSAFEMKSVFWIFIKMPLISLSCSCSLFKAKGKDLFHQRQKERESCHFSITVRSQCLPHFFGCYLICLFLTFAMFLKRLIQCDGSEYLRNMLIMTYRRSFQDDKSHMIHIVSIS